MHSDCQNVIVASSSTISGQLILKDFSTAEYRVEAVQGGAAALEKLGGAGRGLMGLSYWRV